MEPSEDAPAALIAVLAKENRRLREEVERLKHILRKRKYQLTQVERRHRLRREKASD